MRRTSPPLTAVMIVLCGASAGANGRFPQAQHLVAGPGLRDDLVLVRATFGLLLSDDGGGRFQFLCEDAWQFLDGFDPAVLIGARGSMLVGLHNGLTRSRDGCAPQRDPDLDGAFVSDLAANAAGTVVVASMIPPGARRSRVARSNDGGEHFEVLPEALDDVALSTIEVGSADGATLYASGAVGEARSAGIWRSEDGGQRWRRTAARFAEGEAVFVAGVHPSRPEVLWVRATGAGDAGLGATTLLQSDDGGESFVARGRTRGPMQGFAAHGNGRTLWIGGPADGVQRSDDGGPFRVVTDQPVECLRWHADTLWACGPFAPGAPMLWRARGEAPLTVAQRWSQIEGPPARCAPGTISREVCPQRWVAVRSVLAPSRADAGFDAAPDAAVTPPPARGCACRATTSGVSRSARAGWWLAALLALSRWFRAPARGDREESPSPRGR